MRVLLIMVLILLPFRLTMACGEIIPPQEVVDIVAPLAYSDFPKISNILTIISVESSFNPKAKNPNHDGKGTSNGIMQVNGGPFDLRGNIKAGVARLREYFLITGSEAAAIKAYNIGIGNFQRGIHMQAATEYFSKYTIQGKIYADYPQRVNYIGPYLGCTDRFRINNPGLSGPPSGNLLDHNWKTYLHDFQRRHKKASNKGQPSK
jgi:hypothetical protein